MKKDRNCGVPYPVYPPYQGIPYMPGMNMPGMGISNMGMPNMGAMPFNTGLNQNMNMSTDQTVQNLQEQITLLDKRVTNLETMLNTQNNISQYSSSNYQMM